MVNRYDTSHNPEGQYQPGSDEKVLLNKLGITDPLVRDDVELTLLDELVSELVKEVQADQTITVEDLCTWHRRWLGDVYEWAGAFRTVTMSKGGFPFAAVAQLPKLMSDFERRYLSSYTPCAGFDDQQLIEALAVCHVEFIIIHPFREGNGRLSRVLATLMALQAAKPLLNFTYLSENEASYIAAIHAGHACNYEPMKRVFAEVLGVSVRGVG
jgi:cell filamentation protein